MQKHNYSLYIIPQLFLFYKWEYIKYFTKKHARNVDFSERMLKSFSMFENSSSFFSQSFEKFLK